MRALRRVEFERSAKSRYTPRYVIDSFVFTSLDGALRRLKSGVCLRSLFRVWLPLRREVAAAATCFDSIVEARKQAFPICRDGRARVKSSHCLQMGVKLKFCNSLERRSPEDHV